MLVASGDLPRAESIAVRKVAGVASEGLSSESSIFGSWIGVISCTSRAEGAGNSS